MKRQLKLGWIVGGWGFALLASALPVLWVLAERIDRNPMGLYVDPETGAWLPHVYWQFLGWYLRIVVPVSLLAAACMVLNRRPN